MKNGMVKNWMTSPVITVTRETHLTEARKIINEKQIRALPVVEDGKLLGIVTRRGLLRMDLSFLEDEKLAQNVETDDKKVGDVMTLNIITVSPDALIPKAARIMLENKITALPVVENDQVVGILTNSDLLRFILAEAPDLKRKLLVNQYMTDEVVTIDPDTSLLEAHRLMGTKRIRSLLVMDGEKLAGLVTRTDLMSSDPSRLTSRNNQELSLKILTQSVEKVMTHPLITIPQNAPLLEAAEKMLKNKIHCLPVLDDDHKLAGILTESDLFLMIVQKFF